MSRQNRIEYENSFHHVINRGYLKQDIFSDTADKEYFLLEINNIHESHGFIIHSYCLMTNHFHLLVQNPLCNLSKAMHLLLMRYARYFNRKYKKRGKVFEGQFLAPIVCTEEYLVKVSKYIHRNPLGVIVQDLEKWEWSSYQYYINRHRAKPRFLEKDLILSKFSDDDQVLGFKTYTLETPDWKPEDHIFHNTIIGSESFIERISLKYLENKVNTDVIDSYKLKMVYPNRISDIQQHISKLNIDMKLKSQLLVFALKKKTNLTYSEISKKFFQDHAKPTTLSDQVNRLLAKASKNMDLAKLLFDIETL